MAQAVLLLLMGLFVLTCTYYKPNFYWESGKARRFRKLFGDKLTERIYYVLAVFLIFISVMVYIEANKATVS